MNQSFSKIVLFKTFCAALFFAGCKPTINSEMSEHENKLIHETSPYLLQHAHNPVNWYPWNDESLQKAKDNNRLIIISIGYSACHWCHVMEHQVFEDSSAADLMNRHFVSIKVDREERPDIDEVYMTALQLMTGQGGWPLNIVALPDGRPVWGATFVPNEKWQSVLRQLAELWQNNPEKVKEYASNLTEGVQHTQLVMPNTSAPDFSQKIPKEMVAAWSPKFDTAEGGPNRAPKFPMPSNYEFLLAYHYHQPDNEVAGHLKLTLDKMAAGGIYDQLKGGFARYSVDGEWRVPHFEKMLYDNAQLLSLYSKAYKFFGDEEYARIVQQTFQWLQDEMLGSRGEFYSALDADSEGEEGKFYTWEKDELQEIIGNEDWEAFTDYFDLKKGEWEGKVILMTAGDKTPPPQLGSWQEKLLTRREKRVRPGLDDKSLTSWNALMISGLCEAHQAFGKNDNRYYQQARSTLNWLIENQLEEDGALWHSYKDGKSSIEGMIEDYAFSVQAMIDFYEISGEEEILKQARDLVEYSLKNFEDSATGLFYTRNLNSVQLIAKSMETADNVIPASNSIMALNLHRLGILLDNSAWQEQASHMLHQMPKDRMQQYPESYSHWGLLLLKLVYPQFEVAVSGEDALKKTKVLQSHFLPNVLFSISDGESELPLQKNRFVEDKTLIYVCQDMACQLPVTEPNKALEQIRSLNKSAH